MRVRPLVRDTVCSARVRSNDTVRAGPLIWNSLQLEKRSTSTRTVLVRDVTAKEREKMLI